jgi:hypothetical protein
MRIARVLFIGFILLFFCVLPITALPDNEPYWIRMEKIPDLQPREVHAVTAVTNLPVGEEILYQVNYCTIRCHYLKCQGVFRGATGTINVETGLNGLNKTSFSIDASTLNPDEFCAMEQAVNYPPTGVETFRVLDSPDNAYRIVISPIDEVFPGDPLEIIATTDLPVGEKVYLNMYSLSPPYGEHNPYYTELDLLVVTPGKDGMNQTLYRTENVTLMPGDYQIIEEAGTKYAVGNATFHKSSEKAVPPSPAPGFGLLSCCAGVCVAAIWFWRREKKNCSR